MRIGERRSVATAGEVRVVDGVALGGGDDGCVTA
jgi:hypothetical protein